MSATNTRRLARLLDSSLAEPIFTLVPLPVDISLEAAFPEFAEARRYLESLTVERRAELEWK